MPLKNLLEPTQERIIITVVYETTRVSNVRTFFHYWMVEHWRLYEANIKLAVTYTPVSGCQSLQQYSQPPNDILVQPTNLLVFLSQYIGLY